MRRLVDRTGLPGPRGWSGGTFPDAKAEHPVTGVSWYEADAYARFRGKALPTIFQWEKAARDGVFTLTSEVVMPWGLQRGADPRANFDGEGTAASVRVPSAWGRSESFTWPETSRSGRATPRRAVS